MNVIRMLFVKLFVVWIITHGVAQSTVSKFEIMSVPEKFFNFPSLPTYKKQFDVLEKESFDLTQLLPKGYKKDGTVDYTKYIQQGLDEHSNVVFPDFPIQINDSGLELRSNSVILFPSNSKIVLRPSRKGRYEMLRIHGVDNVKVFFPVLDGNRGRHLGREGEWGHGISIYSSTNIEIFNPRVENCWGDGICISQLKNRSASENVNIYYPIIENNRRNGVTIASAKNLKLVKPVISNTYGTSPMAAIDIEPSSHNYILENVVLESPVTFHSRYGIILALSHLSGKNSKPVDITINNHHDFKSGVSFRVARFRDVYKQNPPLKGQIRVNNPTWEQSNIEDLKIDETFDLTPNIYFKGSTFTERKQNSKRIFFTTN